MDGARFSKQDSGHDWSSFKPREQVPPRFYLTQCVDKMVLGSRHPHKIFMVKQ